MNNTSSRSLIVIPARLESTRLPRKLLLRETGKSVLQHTWEAARAALRPSAVLVATDHEAILAEVTRFGGRAVLTRPDCASGTDRVAEVVAGRPDIDMVVNVQGDEPEIEPAAIDRLVERLEERREAVMATLAAPIRRRDRLFDPACVKVVFDQAGRAMYFSRSPIPHARDWSDRDCDNRDSDNRDCNNRDSDAQLLTAEPPRFYQHIGVYAYRREFLLRLAAMPPSPLEQIEKLEQLRVLEAGETILVETIPQATAGIDTAEDYRRFVARRTAAA